VQQASAYQGLVTGGADRALLGRHSVLSLQMRAT
jgi:hypothetical protein